MKRHLLIVSLLLLTLSAFSQWYTADDVFMSAWSAKHNSGTQYRRAVLDFSDSNLFVEWSKHKLVQPSTQNIHTLSYDYTEQALKIAYHYIGVGAADNYDGAVTLGYGYIRKNDSTSQGNTQLFNPFIEQDSIIGSYINMSDVNNRSIRVTYKVKNLSDIASIRIDLFDVNGRETNDNASSIKKNLQIGDEWKTISGYWGRDSQSDPDYVYGWNQDALTFCDGYSEKWWEVNNGQSNTTPTQGLPVPLSRPYTVPLDSTLILPQILFQLNSGSASDSWVKNMGNGTQDSQFEVYIKTLEMGDFTATEAETFRYQSPLTQTTDTIYDKIKNASNDISIAPNPVKDFATINIINDQKCTITIVDVLGQIMDKQTGVGSLKIDCTHFKKGIYFAQIQNSDSIIIRPFIKE
jgi:hypothetical protein